MLRLISPFQYAFRRGHSTTDLLINLTDNIRSNVNGSHMTSLVALELPKAFNNVNYWGLITKLAVSIIMSIC